MLIFGWKASPKFLTELLFCNFPIEKRIFSGSNELVSFGEHIAMP